MESKGVRMIGWPEIKPNVNPVDHGWLSHDTKKLLEGELSKDTQSVIEVGSWLGRSAKYILKTAPNCKLYCIDTWKGSIEHEARAEWAALLPNLYETFIVNMWEHQARVTPLRMESLSGLQKCCTMNTKPELIYLDASHEYEDVLADLVQCGYLFPDVPIVGDDWRWKGVKRAAQEYSDQYGLKLTSNAKAYKIT